MALVVFLIAYVIRRRLDAQNRLNGDTLWRRFFHGRATVEAGRERDVRAGLLYVLLPAGVAGGLVYLAQSAGVRVALYPLELLVLVLLLGAPGWQSLVRAYSGAWSKGDMQAAWHQVQDRLPASERGAALSPEQMHLSVSRAFMLSVFERYFVVVFWYALGGIGAALMARGVLALAEHWPQVAARERYRGMARLVGWVPVRLLSCTFGIAGDFAGWSREIRKVFPGVGRTTRDVLMSSANGSLTGYALDPERFSQLHPEQWPDFGERSLGAIRDLLNRSMLVWICVFALFVIAGVL